MSVINGQEPIAEIKGFKGLFMRGAYEACPPDHLISCNNCTFPGPEQVTIREPVTISSTIGGRTIISFFIANVQGGARLITLNSDGKLYDETSATLLTTWAGADDFAALNIFGRTYMCPKALGFPQVNALYVYNGVYFRLAAGLAPGTGPTLAQLIIGNVSAGVHGVAVSFLSPSGYLSPPSPVSTITSIGGREIEVTNIPTFVGTDSVDYKRVLLVTAANQTELFFLPGGTINNNISTSFSANFFDSALISSADYLNNISGSLYAGSALRFYNGRMVIVGNEPFPDQLLVSRFNDPESFDAVTGIVNFPVDYGLNTCKTAIVILGVLYVMKPSGTYSTQDNGGDPNTWAVTLIDSALGAWDNGVSIFSSSLSSQDVFDSSFIATRRGLMLFQAGTYQPIPFSRKIESLWNLIDPNRFDRVQVAQDVILKRVYVAVTLNIRPANFLSAVRSDTDQFIFVILMMDYQEGLNPDAVKWSTWTSAVIESAVNGLQKMSFENFTLIYTPGTLPIYQLAFCIGDANIYKIVLLNPQISPNYTIPYITDVGGFPINQYITIPPSAIKSKDGIFTFSMININIWGHGRLQLFLYDRSGGLKANLYSASVGVIGTGSQIITPLVMPPGLVVGSPVFVCNFDGSAGEVVIVTAVGPSSFTATFNIPKNSTLLAPVQIYFGPSIIRPFNLTSLYSSVNHYDLQRLINFTSEGMQIVLWNDQDASAAQYFFQISKISIYGNKMWSMRAALAES